MCRRIDRVESVGHYGYGRQSGFQGRAVGRNVYPVGPLTITGFSAMISESSLTKRSVKSQP